MCGEGSQEGHGEVPPQAACFRSRCQLGVWAGRGVTRVWL